MDYTAGTITVNFPTHALTPTLPIPPSGFRPPDAEETYNATLNSVKQSFPQYVRELEGIADGAQVEFHKVSDFKAHPRTTYTHVY